MEPADVLIWTLRILLPIILFCIYFKLQSPKDEQIPGPTGQVYSRRELMDQRKGVPAHCAKPPGIEGIALKDPTEAPALFVAAARPARPSAGPGAGGRRGEGDRGAGRERSDRRRGPGAGADRSDRRAAPDKVEDDATSTEKQAAQEKMHLESLLNFVAFNPGHQQRFFLPDEETPPPPPPKKKPKVAQAPLIGSLESGILCSANTAVSGEAADKANVEAQMVLAGAIKFKRSDVARSIHSQLMDAQVEISDKTFALMIEASVLARDLKSASDFLMKMESSGFCPDSHLLDKVMDLYSLQKSAREQEKRQAAALQQHQQLQQTMSADAPAALSKTPMEALESALGQHISTLAQDPDARSRLSSAAREFVPSFGVAPPPPKPAWAGEPAREAPAAEAVEATAAAPGGGEAAAPPDGGADAMWYGSDEDGDMGVLAPPQQQRTRLTASAEPFQPSFGVPMDQYMYGWAADPALEGDVGPKAGRGEKKKGKENKKEGGKDAKPPSGKASKEAAPKAKATKFPGAPVGSGIEVGSGGKQVWKPKKP